MTDMRPLEHLSSYIGAKCGEDIGGPKTQRRTPSIFKPLCSSCIEVQNLLNLHTWLSL